jgi:hypothetical protein
MRRVYFLEPEEQRVLLVDLSGCTPHELLGTIAEAQRVIGEQPQASLRTLTDVTDCSFDQKTTEALRAYTAHNRPFVRAAAVVGAVGLKWIVVSALARLTGRKFHLFSDRKAALDFLAATT